MDEWLKDWMSDDNDAVSSGSPSLIKSFVIFMHISLRPATRKMPTTAATEKNKQQEANKQTNKQRKKERKKERNKTKRKPKKGKAQQIEYEEEGGRNRKRPKR